ncbi:type II secretion system protein [Ramlibacter sp. WS9]|uniref:type II secretion system protein n=1 Tax=Ramlibacter sp. WS9 TaxID=1882741 RepID=UPI001142826A|nr:prepilin-type N-terminal cleavage/methylation domain-containing protein [Ramlibacter sp. WS9]ROZ79739.1 prepilin-type N-terminal cleavage/methylation domain-containing protein [Ramlibacter sp. WS9]
MTEPRRFRLGFTLIELLVVLAIVATLLMLVAPRYFHKVDATKEAVLRDNLRSVRDVIDKFYGDNGRYPETLEELVEKKYLRALPVDPITESAATWQLVPVPEGYKGTVYDVHSGAQGMDRDGKKYADW